MYYSFETKYDFDVITAILEKMKIEISANSMSRKDIVEKVLLITTANGGNSKHNHDNYADFIASATMTGKGNLKDGIERELRAALLILFTGVYNTLDNNITDKLENELTELIFNAK